jgi:cobalt-precorrin 5A hydrolase
MARDKAMSARYAIGVAGRKGVDAQELVALVREAATAQHIEMRGAMLAALEGRADAQGFRDAAQQLAVNVAFLPLDALRGRNNELLTRSPRVEALYGVGSLAEALALAAAGENSRLLAPRMATARLACAIACAYDKGEDE